MKVLDYERDFIPDPSLALYLPLWKKEGTQFISGDRYGRLFTATGADWTPQGRYFDGIDDMINAPCNITTIDAFTFICWNKPSEVADDKISYCGNGSWFNPFGFYGSSTQVLKCKMVFSGETKYPAINETPSTTEYNMIAVSWYYADTVVDLYYNGASYTQTTGLPAEALSGSVSILYIGKYPGPGYYMHGCIGEIMLFINRKLSAMEIAGIYEATRGRYK